MHQSIESFSIGMKVEMSKVITEDFLSKFIDISGDDNPMHTDKNFAKNSFKKKLFMDLFHQCSSQLYS